jgi:flagellar protein FlaG
MKEAGVVAPDPVLSLVPRSTEPAAAARADPPVTPAAPDLRLVIEEDPATGHFVYKTFDRNTGEVVLQLPRPEMLKAMSAGTYGPGDLIKTQA